MKILIEIDDREIEETSRDLNCINSEPAFDFVLDPPHYDDGTYYIDIELKAKYDEELLLRADAWKAKVGGDNMRGAHVYPKVKLTVVEPYQRR
jgi:hypothetical protein